jgi:hypothetical protein
MRPGGAPQRIKRPGIQGLAIQHGRTDAASTSPPETRRHKLLFILAPLFGTVGLLRDLYIGHNLNIWRITDSQMP